MPDALTPSPPLLAVSKGDSVYCWGRFDPVQEGNTYAIVKGYWNRLVLYDAAGMRWAVAAVEPIPPISRLGRLLAPICWNPRRKIRLTFAAPVPYALDELKREILALVAEDDDILTQDASAKRIAVALEKAGDFGALLGALKRLGVL